MDSDEMADGVVLDFSTDGVLVGIDVHASQKADIQSVMLTNLPRCELKAAQVMI